MINEASKKRRGVAMSYYAAYCIRHRSLGPQGTGAKVSLLGIAGSPPA